MATFLKILTFIDFFWMPFAIVVERIASLFLHSTTTFLYDMLYLGVLIYPALVLLCIGWKIAQRKRTSHEYAGMCTKYLVLNLIPFFINGFFLLCNQCDVKAGFHQVRAATDFQRRKI